MTRTSDIKTLRYCESKWWFGSVANLPRKVSRAMDFGTIVHRQLELWYTRGLIPENRLARAALPVLQQLLARLGVVPAFQRAPGATDGLAEWHFKVQVCGWTYQGTSDLVIVTPPRHTAEGVFVPGELWIIDYKTCSNVHAYGLTGYQLEHDVQLGVYGWQARRQFAPGAREIHVAHVQLHTMDEAGVRHDRKAFEPKVTLEQGVMTLAQAERIWNDAENDVLHMQDLATRKVADVGYNPEHCKAFAGCAYRNHCPHFARLAHQPEPPMYQPQTPHLQDLTREPHSQAHYVPGQVPGQQLPPPPAPAPHQAQPQPTHQVHTLPSSQAPFFVLVDTLPERGAEHLPQPIVHLDQLLAPIQQHVAERAQVPHYNVQDFAKGPPQVIAIFAQPAQAHLLTGTILVDSTSPCSKLALEFFRQRGAVILRGCSR